MVAQQAQESKAGVKHADPVDLQEVRTNYGYETLRILPGNIRYANLTNFIWEGKTPQAVTDAARFLGGGDAVIIDLRQNGGGSPDAVRAMISYFMPADHRLLMSYHDGVTGKTDTSHVTDKLDAPRMVGKPLYVLISGNTGSAAEEFAYHIKNFKLGTLGGRNHGGRCEQRHDLSRRAGLSGEHLHRPRYSSGHRHELGRRRRAAGCCGAAGHGRSIRRNCLRCRSSRQRPEPNAQRLRVGARGREREAVAAPRNSMPRRWRNMREPMATNRAH